MKVAAIDIGTNTFLCLIAEVEGGVVRKTIADKVKIVRLGEGVSKTRNFSKEALVRANDCLAEFADLIRQHGVSVVGAVATSAARDVENGAELLEIGRAQGTPIQIISGEAEAELTFLGVQSNPDFSDDIVVIDVGGGSTEFTYKSQGQIVGRSYDVGGVRMTERFVSAHPVPDRELRSLREFVGKEFKGLQLPAGLQPVAVAGTPTTLAALELGIDYEQQQIEGYSLSLDKLEVWVERLSKMTLEERSSLKGLEPKRADIIVAGGLILAEALRATGQSELKVSTRGVRYGLATKLGGRPCVV